MPVGPRILVIAYDFPPHAAIGTLRTLRLVRHLADIGWRVTVLTGSRGTFLPGTPVDANLELLVPLGVRVIRAPAFRPFDRLVDAFHPRRRSERGVSASVTTASASAVPKRTGPVRALKDWVDAALSIPDKESGWILPAIVAGLWRSSMSRPDIIYSSSPPWSGQVVALVLERLLRRRWVADFRDPWARAPWRNWRQPFRQRAAAMLERRVISRADAVLFVTRANEAEFTRFYGPDASRRFHFVSNGCDASDFGKLTAAPRPGRFVLLHAGSIYGGRNPVPVIRAIASAIDGGRLDRATFRLRLLGSVSPELALQAESARLGISEVVEFVPRVTRAESLAEMVSASALLLVQTGTTVSIPAKTYEYLAAGRPILALTEEGETAQLVRESGLGVAVGPEEPPERIETALLQVVARGSGVVTPAPRELFDAGVQTAAAAKLLEHYARRRRGAATIGAVEVGR